MWAKQGSCSGFRRRCLDAFRALQRYCTRYQTLRNELATPSVVFLCLHPYTAGIGSNTIPLTLKRMYWWKKERTTKWGCTFISQCKRALNLNSMFSNSLLWFCSTLVLVRNCFLKLQETEFSEHFKKEREDVRVYRSTAIWSERAANWSCKTPSTSH